MSAPPPRAGRPAVAPWVALILAVTLALGVGAPPTGATETELPIRIRTPAPASVLSAPGVEAPPPAPSDPTPSDPTPSDPTPSNPTHVTPSETPAWPLPFPLTSTVATPAATPADPPVGAPSSNAPPRLMDSPSWLSELDAIAWWAWHGVCDMGRMVGRAFAAPSPIEIARQIKSGESGLWTLLADAGYALDSVHADIGIFSSTEVSFRLARSLSTADREHVEAEIERYADRDGSPSARLHRVIVRALLDASEDGTYVVEKVDIRPWPWPTARFSISPNMSSPP